MRTGVLALLLGFALPTACVSLEPVAGTTAYYHVLTPTGDPAGRDLAPLRVELLPVDVPHYLRDERIAVRTGGNRIGYSDLRLWAEPLDHGVHRCLAENLARRAGVQVDSTSRRGASIDVRASVRLLAFEAEQQRGANSAWAARMRARWTVLRSGNAGGDATTVTGVFDAAPREVDAGDSGALAAALSTALDELAAEIAAALLARPLPDTPDTREPSAR